MQKIISLFQRNYETDRLVRNEVVPGAEWVLAGEGVATRKWDGACCMIRDGRLFKRYELKDANRPPEGFVRAQEADANTGKSPGWIPVVASNPADRWFVAARHTSEPDPIQQPLADGTYEAIGPHFGGGDHTKNPEVLHADVLMPHGLDQLSNFPRTFEEIRAWFESMAPNGPNASIEGVVWHHPDGRLVKIKARDFGVRRGVLAPPAYIPEEIPVKRLPVPIQEL